MEKAPFSNLLYQVFEDKVYFPRINLIELEKI